MAAVIVCTISAWWLSMIACITGGVTLKTIQPFHFDGKGYFGPPSVHERSRRCVMMSE
jgi:hypothetical protein